MKQINGPGAVIGFCACIAAGLVCGCIPAMIGCILVALGGVVWDFMRGNVTGKKRSPCGAATPTRRNEKNCTYIVHQPHRKVKKWAHHYVNHLHTFQRNI